MKRALIVGIALSFGTTFGSAARADNAGFIYAYALHDSHSRDTFYSADITKPVGAPSPVRPYFRLLLQRDSRTIGGVLPQTLNDNYGLAAAGVQYQTKGGLRLFAQAGSAFDFGPPTPATAYLRRFDARGGVDYYRDWSDPPSGAHHSIGSLYGNVVYYNRYENGLAYFEAERGREFGASSHPFQVFVRASGSQDTRRLYYNDVVSLSGGIRFLTLGRLGPSLGLEEWFNTYTGSGQSLARARVGRSFWSLRPVVTFGASL